MIIQIKTNGKRFLLPDYYIHIGISDGYDGVYARRFRNPWFSLTKKIPQGSSYDHDIILCPDLSFPHVQNSPDMERRLIHMINFLTSKMIIWIPNHGNPTNMDYFGVIPIFIISEKNKSKMLKVLIVLILSLFCFILTMDNTQHSWTTLSTGTCHILREFIIPWASNIISGVVQRSYPTRLIGLRGGA